jgi:hypothetical protein
VEFVPAQFPPNQPDLIDVDDVDFWPQVRTGMWTAADARRYVHHLFDFDERNWASNLGLVSTRTTGQASPSSLAVMDDGAGKAWTRPIGGAIVEQRRRESRHG